MSTILFPYSFKQLFSIERLKEIPTQFKINQRNLKHQIENLSKLEYNNA